MTVPGCPFYQNNITKAILHHNEDGGIERVDMRRLGRSQKKLTGYHEFRDLKYADIVIFITS